MKTAGILIAILVCAIMPARAAFSLPPDTDETAWPIRDRYLVSSVELSGYLEEISQSVAASLKENGAWGTSPLPSGAGDKAVTGMQLFLKLRAEFLNGGKKLPLPVWQEWELPGSGKGLPPHLLPNEKPGDLTPVPEPSTWLMGAASVFLLLCFTWQVHSRGSGVIRVAQRE